MARMRNPGTRLGRPPKMNMPKMGKLPSGEKQGRSPMDGFDSAIPGQAFQGPPSSMPSYHDDPTFRKGGKVRR